MLDISDLQDLAAVGLGLVVHEAGVAELVLLEAVNMRDRLAAEGLADEGHVLSLDVGDDHDLLLGEVMERELVDGVSEDRFLHQDHVGATLVDLDYHFGDVFFLLSQDSVDILVRPHGDRVFDVGLGGGEAELDDGDFRVSHLHGAAGLSPGAVGGEHETVFDDARIFDGPAFLFGDPDITEIDVRVDFGVDDAHDGVDGERCEDLPGGGDHLRGERCGNAAD